MFDSSHLFLIYTLPCQCLFLYTLCFLLHIKLNILCNLQVLLKIWNFFWRHGTVSHLSYIQRFHTWSNNWSKEAEETLCCVYFRWMILLLIWFDFFFFCLVLFLYLPAENVVVVLCISLVVLRDFHYSTGWRGLYCWIFSWLAVIINCLMHKSSLLLGRRVHTVSPELHNLFYFLSKERKTEK